MTERLRGRKAVEQRQLSSPDTRIRGRKGQALLHRRKHLFPLCVECKKQGRLKATETIDHIIPLALGGEDVDTNCQGLCLEHHAEKTALEGNNFAVANHPDWLKRSAMPLTIVCGPPCSGKTTYVERTATHGDKIICLDTIMMALDPAYKYWTAPLDKTLLNRSVRVRNAMLGNLAKASAARAWFIVSAPAQAERDWWHGKLGGQVMLLHPGVQECKRRALARGTPKAIAGIDAWERKARTPWRHPEPRPAPVMIGLDGWPVT